MATVQQEDAAAAADHEYAARVAHREQEVPAVQMQQVDGTVSSTPRRGTGSPQAYEVYEDDIYS